jgi:hypothetical protein
MTVQCVVYIHTPYIIHEIMVCTRSKTMHLASKIVAATRTTMFFFRIKNLQPWQGKCTYYTVTYWSWVCCSWVGIHIYLYLNAPFSACYSSPSFFYINCGSERLICNNTALARRQRLVCASPSEESCGLQRRIGDAMKATTAKSNPSFSFFLLREMLGCLTYVYISPAECGPVWVHRSCLKLRNNTWSAPDYRSVDLDLYKLCVCNFAREQGEFKTWDGFIL